MARIAPFLTDWPMPTLTEVTGHVDAPEPEPFEFEAESEWEGEAVAPQTLQVRARILWPALGFRR